MIVELERGNIKRERERVREVTSMCGLKTKAIGSAS